MNDQPTQREAPAERVPWSRPTVLLSGAFVLALALLGVVLALIGAGSGHQPAGAPPSTTTAASAPPHANTPGGCSLPAGHQDIPWSSPPPVRWGTVGSMQVPQNPAVFGPGRLSGPWNTCFAHDPSGALLAAMNLWAEGTAVPANELFARLAVGAPRNLGNTTALDASGPVQFAGYRYESYTPAEAQVAVVFRGPEGRLLAVATAMGWRAGDWKYLFPAGGTPAMQVIGDLTGYVPWSSF